MLLSLRWFSCAIILIYFYLLFVFWHCNTNSSPIQATKRKRFNVEFVIMMRIFFLFFEEMRQSIVRSLQTISMNVTHFPFRNNFLWKFVKWIRNDAKQWIEFYFESEWSIEIHHKNLNNFVLFLQFYLLFIILRKPFSGKSFSLVQWNLSGGITADCNIQIDWKNWS